MFASDVGAQRDGEVYYSTKRSRTGSKIFIKQKLFTYKTLYMMKPYDWLTDWLTEYRLWR